MNRARTAVANLFHNDFKINLYLSFVFLSRDLVKYAHTHVHTDLRFLPVSEKELKRFYSNKHTYTEKIKLRRNSASCYRSKNKECHSQSAELVAKPLHSSTKAETNPMGKREI